MFSRVAMSPGPGKPLSLGKEESSGVGSRYFMEGKAKMFGRMTVVGRMVKMVGKMILFGRMTEESRNPVVDRTTVKLLVGLEQAGVAVKIGQGSAARVSDHFLSRVAEVNKLFQKQESRAVVVNCGMLWVWKSQVEKVKREARMMLRISEGLDSFWLGSNSPSPLKQKGKI